ncbi:probable hexosyltransferase MUCI70 [Cannabis sativa]|uniref:probable hexosyltransferase MUCI70 n=1 Tax=Cannabis sativa TaxID=3483 RepID=UPI0011DF2CD5|nr:probable hexosyltransferase MUCI70 [Cannabis sativa]
MTMAGGGGSLGLGIRSGSYGSLDKQLQNGVIIPIQASRKPSKMLKERETLFHWICKFAGRKKVGMLLLCLISAAVFVWVLYVGKGEDSQSDHVQIITMNNSMTLFLSQSSPPYEDKATNNITSSSSSSSSFSSSSSQLNTPIIPVENPSLVFPPPPPAVFLGYTLPPGHPCNSFTLPPPPADKKRTGPRPCPVCYLPVEEAVALMPKVPSPSPILKNLTYIYEENLSKETEFGGSEFGGYPTLAQRTDSYDIRESMSMHCGFVRGIRPGRNTGFDIDETDLLAMEQCQGVVVASAIFGNFDEINQPKNISEYSKETVCFFMFIDEVTEAYVKTAGTMDSNRKIGVWRIVVVRNLPYSDGRRTGKIPKLLMHRLFPYARFSLWVDGKLELVVDPYQVLERFLWRKNASFAISKHYKRFDVFVEAEANKAAGKYDNASIDFQVDFYRKEGLTPYTEEKLPITSDVPEGCVIIREHIPISNLFTCLWFNEVDRFTSRDQISFSTVRDKIKAKTNYTINMFLDCERRNFVVQKYHREVMEQLLAAHAPPPPTPVLPPPPPPPPTLPPPPPPTPINEPPMSLFETPSQNENVVNAPVRRVTTRRGRDRRSGSRRHRKVSAGGGGGGSREITSSLRK